ncbi:hypothetical protein ACFL0Q_03475 [Thermodesulfobacteriota bacterium]
MAKEAWNSIDRQKVVGIVSKTTNGARLYCAKCFDGLDHDSLKADCFSAVRRRKCRHRQ